MSIYSNPHSFDQLDANRHMVSVNRYGFFLCLQGSARIMLGEKVYVVGANDLCFYAPNVFFQILDRSDDLQGVATDDAVDVYYPVVNLINIKQRLRIRMSPCVEITEAQTQSIVRLVGIIKESEETKESDTFDPNLLAQYRRYLYSALCLKVLNVYFTNKPVEAIQQSREDGVLNRFLVAVYENCKEKRMVQWYADREHLSPKYFSSIIRERSGKTAIEWIELTTLMYAKQMLATTDMSIKEIAEALSFPDQSNFGRYFRHHIGLSPSDYRKNKITTK